MHGTFVNQPGNRASILRNWATMYGYCVRMHGKRETMHSYCGSLHGNCANILRNRAIMHMN
jgi:hypothetical protein